MAISSIDYPECCQYCPHFKEIQGSCRHELRQSLVKRFAKSDNHDSSCPMFEQWYTEEMQNLVSQIES